VSWSNAVSVYVWMLTRVEQIAVAAQTCILTCTDLLSNPDQKPQTRLTWPTLQGF